MIKFRAWDKLTDTVQDVLDINFKEKTVTVSQKGIVWYRHDNLRSFEDVILMQSTGLKDKNGVEIYEGDIAETRKSDLTSVPHEMVGGVVTYDSDYGMFKLVRKYGSKFHPFTIWLTNVEIIGNIYADPELLSQGIE